MSYYTDLQSVREQAGFQYKERGESLGTGDGVTVIFTVNNKPFVDKNYSGTPVGTPDVVAYANGTEVTVLSIDATQGRVTLVAAPSTSTPITVDYDWSPISDEVIESYLSEAHNLIDSSLIRKYSLPLSSIPGSIKLIEKKLAAGLLLDKEYSAGGDETEDTRGRRWIKWAEKMLADIVDGNIALLNSAGVQIDQLSGVSAEGWPNSTTEDLSEDESGGGIKFRVKKDF